MILLDTSVLSAVLRRRRKGDAERELTERLTGLLQGDEVVGVPGIVLQVLLSGIKDRAQHDRVLRGVKDGFPVVLASEGDHLKAAEVTSRCAGLGVTLSTPDAFIAAQAQNRRAHLFTTDEDFRGLPAAVGLRLF